jgi:hypothetical protein
MKYDLPDYVKIRELDGEAVLLNLDSEKYFGLDEVGTSMIRALTSGRTVEEACASLLEQYDVDPDTLKSDLDRLIAKLLDKGLIQASRP